MTAWGGSIFSAEDLTKSGTGGATNTDGLEDGQKTKADDGVGDEPNEEDTPFAELANELRGMSGESDAADDLLSHIVTRVTDEGLVIEVFAKEGQPLFDAGSDAPTAKMDAILRMIAGVVSLVKNEIAITGHTDAAAFRTDDMDNWRLSTARADASRRTLTSAGLDPERFDRITGKAARELALPDAPLDPRNRRISLVLLRSDR